MQINSRSTRSHICDAAVVAAALLISLSLSTQAMCAPQYSQYRGDAQRTGFSRYCATYSPSLTWTCTAPAGTGASAVIGEDGTAYYSGSDTNLYAIARNGSVKWRYTAEALTGGGAAIGSDGSLYFISTYGRLYAVNSGGTSKWTTPFSTGSTAVGAPLIGSDGVIYFGADNKYVYAVNPDGTLKWSYRTGGAVKQSLTMSADGSTVYACANDGRVYAIGADGKQKWTSGVVLPAGNCTVGADGRVYVGGSDGTYGAFYALDSSGRICWSYSLCSRITSAPAIGIDGSLYFGCEDNRLYALNSAGGLKWSYTSSGAIYSAPVVDASGMLMFGSYSGKLTGLNAANGSFLWSRSAGTRIYASPVIGTDGSIFVTNADGQLLKFQGPVASVPEPASMLALGSGIIGLFGARGLRRPRRK